MSFYFCEKCGKRVTAADLARGHGRDKQLKGVHCAACSEGTMTMAFDAVTQAEIGKDEQAQRQGQRRSTSTRMPATKAEGAAPRRGRGQFAVLRSHKSNTGVVWAVLAVVVLGVVGAFFAIGFGSHVPGPVASNRSPGTTPIQAESSSAPVPEPRPVALATAPAKAAPVTEREPVVTEVRVAEPSTSGGTDGTDALTDKLVSTPDHGSLNSTAPQLGDKDEANTKASASTTPEVTDPPGVSGQATVSISNIAEGPSSKDSIVGEKQENSVTRYFPNSGRNYIGVGGSSEQKKKTDQNVVLGYRLPTLPAGSTVTGGTFRFKIAGARGLGSPVSSLHVYLLNTSNPDASGTSFFYHGAIKSTDSAKFVGTASVDAPKGAVMFEKNQPGIKLNLTGDALALLQRFYVGDNVPDQTETFFRFNMDKDPSIHSQTGYYINLGDNESSLEVHYRDK